MAAVFTTSKNTTAAATNIVTEMVLVLVLVLFFFLFYYRKISLSRTQTNTCTCVFNLHSFINICIYLVRNYEQLYQDKKKLSPSE